MNSYMHTYTGKKINPLAFIKDDIDIQDIAHALSLLCRGGGHLKIFYSVAQHSLNCAQEAFLRYQDSRLSLACLLHDASEAYISDIIRPLKQHLKLYEDIESQWMKVIFEKYELSELKDEDLLKIKRIDYDMLAYKLYTLMEYQSKPTCLLKSQPCFAERHHHDVEKEFLELFERLSNIK